MDDSSDFLLLDGQCFEMFRIKSNFSVESGKRLYIAGYMFGHQYCLRVRNIV